MRQSVAAARREVQARQADLNSAGGAGSSLSSKLQSIEQRLSYLEEQRADFSELEQRVKIDQDNYNYYVQRGEEARANNILNEQNITRISVIDTPMAPMLPASRHRKMLLIAFLMTGGILGLVAVLAFEMLDDRFRAPNQVSARLGVPVFATFALRGKA